MAQFNLRYATLYIKDAYAGPGGTPLVNHMAGYATGATTIVVDGFSGAVANYDRFTLAGDLTVYQVSSHSETLSITTSITFTPALAADVADDIALTFLPHLLQVKVGEGTLSYDEKRAFKYVTDRGYLDTVRQEADVPLEVKIEVIWEWIKASGSNPSDPPTIEDALKKRGQAANWVTSSSDACEIYAVDIEVVYDPPCDVEPNEVLIFPDFRYESISHDMKNGMLSISGKCNTTEATATRNSEA